MHRAAVVFKDLSSLDVIVGWWDATSCSSLDRLNFSGRDSCPYFRCTKVPTWRIMHIKYPIWIHVPDACKFHGHHLQNFKSHGKISYHSPLIGTVDTYLMCSMKYKFTCRKKRVSSAEFGQECSNRPTYQRIRNMTSRSQFSICHSM